ncbi:MAG: DUF4440 domain-containing protein [Verrucomicrobia bacterium]|nr:DUF4440 domain-containing protein [Verrucomicrobiota bacterium]
MKKLTSIFFLLFLTATFGLCDNQNHETQLKELDSFLKKWTEAFNEQDIDALVSLYDENADVISIDGVQRNDRKEMKQFFNDSFCKNRQVTEKITNVKRTFLSPTIVIETGMWHHSGNTDPLAPTIGRYACTLSKEAGEWQYVHERSWAIKDSDSDGSKLKSKDKLSIWAKNYLEASIKGGLEKIDLLLHSDVEVFVNDLKIRGKSNYIERLRKIQNSILDPELKDMHSHTNYFAKEGLASNGLTWKEVRANPSIWSNCWAVIQAIGKKSGKQIEFRMHADLRWEDDKIVEMLFYYDPQQLNAEMDL